MAARLLAAAPVAAQAALYPPMPPPLVEWIASGRARATIVATSPTQGTAPAAELNQWLKRLTGVALPVESTKPATGPAVFLGGDAAWKRLGTTPEGLGLGGQGYAIRTLGDDLVIAGKTDLDTLFGVYAFLEHYLGCRWFWPGETGMVAPRQETLRVGRIDEVSEPDFPLRWTLRDKACARFNGANVGIGEPEDFRIQWFVHTWLRLVEPSEYWAEHPEFYADLGGKRADPTGKQAQVNLCTTNPEVVEAAVRKIDEVVAGDPSIDMVSVDPMDTQQFCQCAECRKLQDPEAPYEARNSRLVFDFTNRVAEQVAQKHPGLLIKTIAYHTYLAPPPFAMRDNVVIQFCRFMCHNHSLAETGCPESAYFGKYLQQWRDKGALLMLYEYYYKASWCGLPWPIAHMLRRDLPYMHRSNVAGVATQWDHNYANNGLGQYVATKLLWNSRLSVDELLSDFYEKAYAEAADPMRRYHERLETTLEQSGVHVAEQRGYRTMLQFLSPELLAGCAADLEAARTAVRDPEAAQRVALMAKGFDYARLVAAYLTAVAQHGENAREPYWYTGEDTTDTAALEAACAPHVEALRAFLQSAETEGARHGLFEYEELLLSPKGVAGNWYRTGDRPEGVRLTKPEWLEHAPQQLSKETPQTVSLWVYGNDIDWMPDTGPEHTVYARGKDGAQVLLGTMGRQDRAGDGGNLAFVFRGVDPGKLSLDPLQVVVENPPGGPYGTRLFALYLMPDDNTSEDEATRLLQEDLEAVRRRAAAFVEFGFNGDMSNEGDPAEATLDVPGFPVASFTR